MKKCIECSTVFKPKNIHHKYCSKECGIKKWNIGEELICRECDKNFIKKYVNQKYCSPECRDIYNKRIVDARYAEKKKQQEIEDKYYGRTN